MTCNFQQFEKAPHTARNIGILSCGGSLWSFCRRGSDRRQPCQSRGVHKCARAGDERGPCVQRAVISRSDDGRRKASNSPQAPGSRGSNHPPTSPLCIALHAPTAAWSQHGSRTTRLIKQPPRTFVETFLFMVRPCAQL